MGLSGVMLVVLLSLFVFYVDFTLYCYFRLPCSHSSIIGGCLGCCGGFGWLLRVCCDVVVRVGVCVYSQ